MNCFYGGMWTRIYEYHSNHSCFIRNENNKLEFKRNSVNAIKLCRHFFAPALCKRSLKQAFKLKPTSSNILYNVS